MKQTLSLKKSLLVSGAAMLLCGAMLAGTTFAWFTSTAASGKNTITAGTLDVELQYKNGDAWKDATDHSFFTESTKWEPGMLVVSEPFRIANVGSRDLKYSVSLETEDYLGERKLGESENRLSTVISHTLVKSKFVTDLKSVPQETTRQDMWDSANDPNGGDSSYVPTTSILVKNPEKTSPAPENSYAELAMVLYWKPTAEDSDYNVEDNTQPYKIKFHLHVFATQASVEAEKDGVDEHYDKGAPLGPAAATSESVEIYGAIDNGTTQIDHFATALFEDIQDPKYADDFKSTPVSGSLSISPLEYNAAEEKYEATISFKDATNGLVLIGVPGIVGLIHNAVAQHKEAIDTITIAGTEVPADVIDKLEPLPNDGSTIDFAGATLQDVLSNHSETSTGAGWLFMPLATWGADGGDVMEFAISLYTGDLSGLNDRACDVVITDKEGNSVTYSLAFKVT